MRRTRAILRQQKDACSCWVCRDRKYREKRKTANQKSINEELMRGLNDDEIIFELQMKATYINHPMIPGDFVAVKPTITCNTN